MVADQLPHSKLGVMGGTFDPVHIGHLIIAQEAQHRLALSRVLFIPAGQPWLKAAQPITPAAHRLEMLRLAVAGPPGLGGAPLEVDRLGPTYTVDTVVELRRQAEEVYFILGQDSLMSLPRWREPARLVELCYLVVAPRPGVPPLDIALLEKSVPGVGKKVVLLPGPLLDVSATEIRVRVARGEPIRYWVPDGVEAYIGEKELYRA